jgi:hypothetical protein
MGHCLGQLPWLAWLAEGCLAWLGFLSFCFWLLWRAVCVRMGSARQRKKMGQLAWADVPMLVGIRGKSTGISKFCFGRVFVIIFQPNPSLCSEPHVGVRYLCTYM